MSGNSKVYAMYVVAQTVVQLNGKSDTGLFSKEALLMAQPFLKSPEQAYPLSLLAGALANMGRFNEAIQLANGIADEQRREEATVMIAVHLVIEKNTNRAMDVLQSLPPVPANKTDLEAAREMGWVRIAIAEANAGDGTTALKTLEAVHDPRLGSIQKWQSSYAAAVADRLADAESIAVKIPEEHPIGARGNALRLVGAVYARNKGASEAMNWAAQLTMPEDRANAYVGVADGLLGEPAEEIPPYFED